jgi:nicotinamide mononucleotide transporter
MWKKKMQNTDTVIMRKFDNKKRGLIFIVCIVLTLLCSVMLNKIPGQNTAYLDGLTTVLSVAAIILMMYRFQEQWFLYITLNIFTIIMWSIRMANGSDEGSSMVTMWTIYLLNSIYGYIKWNIGAKRNELDGIE